MCWGGVGDVWKSTPHLLVCLQSDSVLDWGRRGLGEAGQTAAALSKFLRNDEPARLAAPEFPDAFFLPVFFPSVSETPPAQHSNGQQQHRQHSTSQEAGRTAEDGSQHR